MMIYFGLDLDCACRFCDPAKYDFAGVIDEPGQAGVCASDGTHAADDIPSLRDAVSGRTQGEDFLVPGSVPVHGVRAVDLSGEPSGHRSLLACLAFQALSPWDSFGHGAQYAGQRQHGARLAHLRRRRTEPDWYCSTPLYRRILRCRSEGDGLRARHDDHRFVSVRVSVGTVSDD